MTEMREAIARVIRDHNGEIYRHCERGELFDYHALADAIIALLPSEGWRVPKADRLYTDRHGDEWRLTLIYDRQADYEAAMLVASPPPSDQEKEAG